MIKFLANENISPSTVEFVKTLGYDIEAVRDVGLKGMPDQKVIEYAIAHDRIIITLDLDYGEAYYFSSHNNLGVIVLRLKSQWLENINVVLERFLASKKPELDTLKNALVLLHEYKCRIFRK